MFNINKIILSIVFFNKFCHARTVVQQVPFLTDSGVKPEAKLAREPLLLPTESHGATICRISTLDELSYPLALLCKCRHWLMGTSKNPILRAAALRLACLPRFVTIRRY